MFARRGYRVVLIEGRADWRPDPNIAHEATDAKHAIKRSINLALSHRGQMALKSVGLLDKVMEFTIPMRSRAIHNAGKDATTPEADTFQPYDEIDSSNAIYSVSREKLNNLLLDECEKREAM